MSLNKEISETAWNRLAAIMDAELGIQTICLQETDTADNTGQLAQRAEQYEHHRRLKRQANLEAVLKQAVLQLDTAAAESGETAIDTGWLADFLEGAAHAAYQVEQTIWAGLLAREIKAPGTTARRTLHRLHEMDHWEVEAFIEYLAFVFAFDSGWRFMFEEDIARRELWAYGREIDISQHLINIGLLSPELNRLDTRNARGLTFRYADKIYELESVRTDTSSPSSGFHYRRLTPQGQQLADTIRPKRFTGYARNLVNALNKELGVCLKAVEACQPD